jgi:hypothetical protein
MTASQRQARRAEMGYRPRASLQRTANYRAKAEPVNAPEISSEPLNAKLHALYHMEQCSRETQL